MAEDPSAGLLAILLTAAVAIVLLAVLGRRHGVVLIALVAFVLRVLRGLDVQNSGYVSDAFTYDYLGIARAQYWQGLGPDPGSDLGKDGWPTILAMIYYVVGHTPEVGYLINALAGGFTVIVVASITYQMGWFSAIKPASWLVAVWPVAFLWGGMLLREAIVTLLLGVGLWGSVRLYKRRFVSGTLVVVGAGIAMVPMRGGLAFLVLIGMPLTAAAAANLRFRIRPSTIMLTVGASALAFLAMSYLSQYFDGTKYFEYRTEVSLEQNSGNSSFVQAGLGGGAVDQSLVGHAIRVPLTAFGPLPFQVTNPSLLLAGIDALLWLCVWALVIFATVRLKARAEAVLFVVPTVALIVYLAANASNFGLIIRLRGLGIVLVAPIAALGWVAWRQYRQDVKARRRQRTIAQLPNRARQLRASVDHARKSAVRPEVTAELEQLLR